MVLITVPPGAFYRPVFQYHGQAEEIGAYHNGRRLLSIGSRESLNKAGWAFNGGIEAPSFVPLIVAQQEQRLLRVIMKAILDDHGPIWSLLKAPSVVMTAQEVAKSISELPRERGPSAYASLIEGAAHLLQYKTCEATRCFELATFLDAEQARSSLWYALYLVLVQGKAREAQDIIDAKLRVNPHQGPARLVGALLLYTQEEYDRAYGTVHGVSMTGGDKDCEHLLRCLIQVGSDVGSRYRQFPISEAIEHLNFQRHGGLDGPTMNMGKFHGFGILTGSIRDEAIRDLRSGKPMPEGWRRAIRSRNVIRSWQNATHFDYLLAYTAIGDIARALVWYRRACKQSYFLCPWLDILPCFKPLTRHPLFTALKNQYWPAS